MVGHAERRVQEAQGGAAFWKGRYIKLAWLANQALMNIPRSLHAVEYMTNAAIAAMAGQEAMGYAQSGYTIAPPPHNKDPPYEMPYGWNTRAHEEEQ
ncbi:hypothetical protein CR513_11729, partial [Mucuna pruriens]